VERQSRATIALAFELATSEKNLSNRTLQNTNQKSYENTAMTKPTNRFLTGILVANWKCRHISYVGGADFLQRAKKAR